MKNLKHDRDSITWKATLVNRFSTLTKMVYEWQRGNAEIEFVAPQRDTVTIIVGPKNPPYDDSYKNKETQI